MVGRLATTGRLATARTRGTIERLRLANGKRGRWAYIVVQLPSGRFDANYRLDVTSAAIPR